MHNFGQTRLHPKVQGVCSELGSEDIRAVLLPSLARGLRVVVPMAWPLVRVIVSDTLWPGLDMTSRSLSNAAAPPHWLSGTPFMKQVSRLVVVVPTFLSIAIRGPAFFGRLGVEADEPDLLDGA
jgi:hypothetical protein